MSKFEFTTDYARTSFGTTMDNFKKELDAGLSGAKDFGEAFRTATAILHRENQRLELLMSIDKVMRNEDDRVRAMHAYWLAHRLMTGDDKLDKNEALGLVWLKNAADWGDDRAKYELGE